MPQTVLSHVLRNFLQICILCTCPPVQSVCFPDPSLLPEPPAPGNAAAVSPCIVPMYCPHWWLLTLAPHGSALPAPPALTQQAAFRKLSETYLQDF